MQNVASATRLQPRLMAAVLMALKECERKGIPAKLIVEQGVDFRAKILTVEKGKPVVSKKINDIVSGIAEKKSEHKISFDGEFIRIDSMGAVKEEKEFETINLSEETSEELKEEPKKRKKKSE